MGVSPNLALALVMLQWAGACYPINPGLASVGRLRLDQPFAPSVPVGGDVALDR